MKLSPMGLSAAEQPSCKAITYSTVELDSSHNFKFAGESLQKRETLSCLM